MPNSKYTKVGPEVLSEQFLEKNKRFYREEEDYDWVEAADHLVGLESIFHKLRERTIVKLIQKQGKPGSYLDAGCGTGLLLRHLPPGSIGLDINPRNVARARVHAPHARVVEGDVEALPFGDQSFSTIILTEILEHLPDPTKMLEEVWRVLTPGGVVIGSTPRRSILWKLRMLSSTCPGEPFHREFNGQELKELLGQYGQCTMRLKHLGMSWVFTLEKVAEGHR